MELQLKALQEHSAWCRDFVDHTLRSADVNNGVRACFDFASPENQAATGPLERFAPMIMRGYPCLVNCDAFALRPILNGRVVHPEEEEVVERGGAGEEGERIGGGGEGGGGSESERMNFVCLILKYERPHYFKWYVERRSDRTGNLKHLNNCWQTSGVTELNLGHKIERCLAHLLAPIGEKVQEGEDAEAANDLPSKLIAPLLLLRFTGDFPYEVDYPATVATLGGMEVLRTMFQDA